VLDQFLSFQTDNNDHQMRAVLCFEGRLDLAALRAAVLRTFRLVPVLGCRYVEHAVSAYWEEVPFDCAVHEFVTLVDSFDVTSEVEAFLSLHVDHHRGPQLLARVVRGPSADTLCIVVNHMAFEGAAFKRYLVTLGRCYGDVVGGHAHTSASACSVDRGLGRVLRSFTARELLRLALRSEHAAIPRTAASLPGRARGEQRAAFVRRRIEPAHLDGLASFARARGVTLNDVVLAAYYVSLWEAAQPRDGVLSVACMVDLRRHLGSDDDAACSNLASMVRTECGYLGGFSQTLSAVHAQMARKKAQAPGVSGLPLLALLGRLLPHSVFERVVKRLVDYPPVSVTDLGVIPDELCWGGVALSDAFILTALKREPCLQLTFSTFRRTMTVSASVFGTEPYRRSVADLIDSVSAQLEQVAMAQ
jgi:NRPS condensation-like uncharacterized protein